MMMYTYSFYLILYLQNIFIYVCVCRVHLWNHKCICEHPICLFPVIISCGLGCRGKWPTRPAKEMYNDVWSLHLNSSHVPAQLIVWSWQSLQQAGRGKELKKYERIVGLEEVIQMLRLFQSDPCLILIYYESRSPVTCSIRWCIDDCSIL